MKLERLDRAKYRDVISPGNFREVNLAFYYVVKLQQYEAAGLFKNWNEAVEEAIYNSPEFKGIDKNDFSFDFQYEQRRVEIAKIYGFQALDDKYKLPSDPTVEEMRDSYEKGIEWSRKYREQAAEALPLSALDFLPMEPEGDDPLPF